MITVDLKPDQCREYKAWSEYCEQHGDSAVLNLTTEHLHGWNATARNRLRHSQRLGYFSREIDWAERTNYLEDIHQINVSKAFRQRKPMGDYYLEFPKEITGRKTCEHHYGTFIGCFGTRKGTEDDTRLVAYITTNFCGEIAAASQILGHGDLLKDGIMLNVWATFVDICILRGVKYIVYSRWNDGWNGLKYWKRSVGMRPEALQEIPILQS